MTGKTGITGKIPFSRLGGKKQLTAGKDMGYAPLGAYPIFPPTVRKHFYR